MSALRIGTRGSALALAQAGMVAASLDAAGTPAELVVVRTEGDVSRASLASIGGTGVFAGALRRSLADGGCDLVVHSLKDLPTAAEADLDVISVPGREDVRDVLVGSTLVLYDGRGTGGPPASTQRSRRDGPGCSAQAMVTRPVGAASAPCFTAFVASSCTAIARG